jgi:hypothetical protein
VSVGIDETAHGERFNDRALNGRRLAEQADEAADELLELTDPGAQIGVLLLEREPAHRTVVGSR